MKAYFEVQYSVDGETWLRFMDRHPTREAAAAFAQSKSNEEIETRTAKVTVETLDRFAKIPGKTARAWVLPGVGVIS